MKTARPSPQRLHELPPRRDILTWQAYLGALIPVLDLVLEVRQRRCLRRLSFRTYLLRDQALDAICARITAGHPQTTLVAFGGANSCSTGFGHAPAPQGRLRRRLGQVHGARVCLVDEYRTSQACCRCHGQLEHAVATAVAPDTGETKHRKPLHHVLFCKTCKNSRGAKQFYHRDYNAAKNILACYLAEAGGVERPKALCRSKLNLNAASSPPG